MENFVIATIIIIIIMMVIIIMINNGFLIIIIIIIIMMIIKTITKFSNVIGYQQPICNGNRTEWSTI